MFKKLLILVSICLLLVTTGAIWAVAAKPLRLMVDGETVSVQPVPLTQGNRVFVPIRFVAETLGAQVYWDAGNSTVVINQGSRADLYLKGQIDPLRVKDDIANNLIKNSDLKDILDDDKDNDLGDYRTGHNGGDVIGNDPLIVDLREQSDYDAGHIPTAVWIDVAANMAEERNVKTLKGLLDAHVEAGGKNEIVVYCYTGNTSGLVSGVLGSLGFNVKNLKFGYDIAWAGTKSADRAVKATIEDKEGHVRTCGG